jgi:hypothetical protein
MPHQADPAAALVTIEILQGVETAALLAKPLPFPISYNAAGFEAGLALRDIPHISAPHLTVGCTCAL